MTEQEKAVIEAAKNWANASAGNIPADNRLLKAVAALEANKPYPEADKKDKTVCVELDHERVVQMSKYFGGHLGNACRRALADTPLADDDDCAACRGTGTSGYQDPFTLKFHSCGACDGTGKRPAAESDHAEPAPVEGAAIHFDDEIEGEWGSGDDSGLIADLSVEGGGPYLIYENYEMVDGKEEPRPFTVIDGIHLAGGGYTMEAIVRIANRAYSQGFTAGQKGRSDCGDPASPDLVAAARELLDAADEEEANGGLETNGVSNFLAVNTDRLDRLRIGLHTALQNTPQPDESEAVKLLRELVAARNRVLDAKRERFRFPTTDETTRLKRAHAAAEAFLSNTPEVNDAE